MPTIQGLDLTLSIAGDAVGAERGVTITITNELVDFTTKDSGGNYECEYGNQDWTVSLNGLYVFNDTAQDAVLAAIAAGTALTALVSTGTAGQKEFTGSARVQTYPETHPNAAPSTISGTLMGAGELTYQDTSA